MWDDTGGGAGKGGRGSGDGRGVGAGRKDGRVCKRLACNWILTPCQPHNHTGHLTVAVNKSALFSVALKSGVSK